MVDQNAHPKLEELIAVLHRLRAPGGCAWDQEQTHASLVQYLVEETYELVDAIETGSRDDLIEELGDVLYQVIFHSDIASHTPGEDFSLEDVAERMTAKMVGRHPHVFGDAEAQAAMNIRTGDDVVAVWDELKKADKPGRTSVLDGIPQAMPALALADKLLGRAGRVGLTHSAADSAAGVAADVADDVAAGSATGVATGPAAAATEDALGDQLLAIVSAARVAGLDSERALRGALRRLQGEIRQAEAQSSEPEARSMPPEARA